MTKKCFAAIMTAQEVSAEVKKLTDEVKEKGVTVAYKNIMKIAELNDKYYTDFYGIDPYWTPDSAKKNAAPAAAESTPKAETPAETPAAAPAAPAYNYAVENEENFM